MDAVRHRARDAHGLENEVRQAISEAMRLLLQTAQALLTGALPMGIRC